MLSVTLTATHAVDRTGVRALVGAATYRQMGGAFRSAETDLAALDYLAERFGGVRLSNRIPAAASNVQQAIIRRSPIRPVTAWRSCRYVGRACN